MNMFTINASVLIGANVFGVRKADLLTGEFTYPSVVTYTDWFPYPGFTIVPSMTQVCLRPYYYQISLHMTSHSNLTAITQRLNAIFWLSGG